MNIQEQLNSLIRGNPLSVDTYLREVCKNESRIYIKVPISFRK